MADKFKLEIEDMDLTEVTTIIRHSDSAIDKRIANLIGVTIINEMKKNIRVGRSPIRGRGIRARLPGYRGSYLDRIQKKQIRGKSKRPVNLKLTGDFLRDLDFKTERLGRTTTTKVGFYEQESIDKELGHRLGTNNQAKRPIIPIVGEKFARTTMNKIEDIYEIAVRKHLRKKFK